MRDEHSALVEEIRKAISSGALSRTEIEGRLTRAIEEESIQQDHPADSEFLNVCLDLLADLKTGGQFSYTPDIEETKGSVFFQYEKHAKGQNAAAKTIKAVCMVLVLLVVGGFGVLVPRYGWLSTSVTPDEQQYVVEKQDMNAGVNSYADDEIAPDVFVTTDLDEAIARLGFEPHVPTNLRNGWSVRQATVMKAYLYRRLIVVYADDESGLNFIYDVCRYDSSHTADLCFEQNQQGELIKLHPAINMYHAKNVEHNLFSWIEKDTIYSVYGDVDDEKMLEIVQSIIEGAE